MHMHCHLSSCLKEFGPLHSFWLFPFERYNGVLEGQPTNNRSVELQLMRQFQKDNSFLHLHHEAKFWPDACHFLDALPEITYDINDSFKFDDSIKPGPKSVLGMFTTDSMPIIHKLYTKLYPTEISDSEIPFTFKSILLLLGMENS